MIAAHVYSARTGKHAYTDDSHAVVSVWTDKVSGEISAVSIYANAPTAARCRSRSTAARSST